MKNPHCAGVLALLLPGIEQVASVSSPIVACKAEADSSREDSQKRRERLIWRVVQRR